MERLFRRTVREMEPYHAPYVVEGIKLDANENTYPVLEALKMHMSKWVQEMPLNYYPDTASTKLCTAIGKRYGLDWNWVLCGVGSDQVIDCIMRATLEVGECVLVPNPSFSMYKLTATLNRAKTVEVPLHEDFSYDIATLEKALLTYQPKLTFLCNPNNPTGSTVTLEAIKGLLQHKIGFLVVDEAYMEFGGESAISLLKDYPQLIVLRTFSKAYGLAGSRVGYALARPEVIQMIGKVKPPYNLNCFSQEAATWVAEHYEAFVPYLQAILESKEDFKSYLESLGCVVYPSASNFLWVKSEWPLDQLLKGASIYVKRFAYKEQVYYCIAIGTKTQMEVVKEVLKVKLEGGV